MLNALNTYTMKHTKEKWLTKRNSDGIEIYFWNNNDGVFQMIAQVTDFSDPYNEIEEEANAKLISKAPEMYEELKGIYSHLMDLNSFLPDPNRGWNIKIAERLQSLLKEIES